MIDIASAIFGSADGRKRRCSAPNQRPAIGNMSTGNMSMKFIRNTQKNTTSAIGATNFAPWW